MEVSGDYALFKNIFIVCMIIIVVLFIVIYRFLKKKDVQVDTAKNLLRLSLALFPVILLPFLFSPILTRNNKILLTVIGLGISIVGFLAAGQVSRLLLRFFDKPS